MQRERIKDKGLPSLRELVDLVVHAEMDKDPYIVVLMKNLALDYDEEIARDVLERVRPALIKKALIRDPFAPNPTGNDIDGIIKIGKVRNTDAPFGLNLDELCQHTLITGRSGAGKTTLIYIILIQLLQHGIPFWAFDFKQDYRHLAKTGKVLVFDYENFRFNPLRPPLGVNPHIWMQSFTNVFCQAYWLLSGTDGVILEHVNRLYNDYGVYSGSDVYPTMLDLYESLKRYHKPDKNYGRGFNYLESAQNRVGKDLISFSKMFDCDKGYSIEELLNKNVVFELEGLNTDNQRFLLTILLRYVLEYRIANNQRGKLRHLFLFDEAKIVYSREREFSKELGTSEIAQFTSQIREFGEGLIVADQMPTKLADSIKANVYTIICMSQSGGQSLMEMSRAIGLNREQDEACRMLQSDKANNIFEAIVKLSSKWLTPFIIYVMPYPVQKDVTNVDVHNFMTPLLTTMNKYLIPRTEYKLILDAKQKEQLDRQAEERKERQQKAEEKGIVEGNILIKILTNIRDHPFIDQKNRIEMLGLASSSSTTDKYFKELVAKGFVNISKIGFGKEGSTRVLYEITPEGAKYAKMDSFSIPGKGDFRHKFWQHTIKTFYETMGSNAEIEKRFGLKNVDVGYETNGKKVGIEVELTSEHLIENLQKDFEAGCETVIVAVPNKRAINAYKKKIPFYNKHFLDKVEFRVLTDFLP